jgi:hypothetical protein
VAPSKGIQSAYYRNPVEIFGSIVHAIGECGTKRPHCFSSAGVLQGAGDASPRFNTRRLRGLTKSLSTEGAAFE